MGTTDVTRTVFLGHESTISAYQRECFTRVLKGHIQLSSRVFPSGTRSELLDSFARQALWQAGLDYRHGRMFYFDGTLFLLFTFKLKIKDERNEC